MFATEDMQKAQEAAQAFREHLKKSVFSSIGMVYSVHEGANRAQRRQMKFKNGGKPNGKPTRTNTQRPNFF